jgi:hypothetical protein
VRAVARRWHPRARLVPAGIAVRCRQDRLLAQAALSRLDVANEESVHCVRRGREFRVPGGAHADEWFADNTLSMLSVAALLENETWAMALRVVSPDWWDRRTDELAAPAHAESDSKPAPPHRRLFRKP